MKTRTRKGWPGGQARTSIGVKIPRQRPNLAPRNVGGVNCVAKILCPARHILTPMLVRGRPPGRPLRDRIGLFRFGEERVQGDPRGPGGPPYGSKRLDESAAWKVIGRPFSISCPNSSSRYAIPRAFGAPWKGSPSAVTNIASQSLTMTVFTSVYCCNPYSPSSRPIPDCLNPPNGALGSKTL